MRLIDADALIAEMHNVILEDGEDRKIFYEVIERQPTITQPERKTGKWISTDDGWDGEYFVCSVCGCPWTLIEGSPEDNGMNFCPNCGADMRGKQNEH